MTSVNAPNTGTLRRRRVFQPGSLGAIALVVAVGAAIASGIAITDDDAAPAPATVTVTPSANTFTKEREAGATTATRAGLDSSDKAHMNRAPKRNVESPQSGGLSGGSGPAGQVE